MEKIKNFEPQIADYNPEEIFREYFENFDLQPEDFDKEILDIGSGSAKFAKWAKDHHVSSSIYSIDLEAKPEADDKFVLADVINLPFADESFDLVLSHAAIPAVFSGIKSKEKRLEMIDQGLKEMLRVVKEGGRIRIAPLAVEYEPRYKKLNRLQDDFFVKLEELRKEFNFEVVKKKIGAVLLVILNKNKSE